MNQFLKIAATSRVHLKVGNKVRLAGRAGIVSAKGSEDNESA